MTKTSIVEPIVAPRNALQAMRQQLATIKPVDHVSHDATFMESLALVIGAMPSAALSFKDAVATSYKYHEAVRKEQL